MFHTTFSKVCGRLLLYSNYTLAYTKHTLLAVTYFLYQATRPHRCTTWAIATFLLTDIYLTINPNKLADGSSRFPTGHLGLGTRRHVTRPRAYARCVGGTILDDENSVHSPARVPLQMTVHKPYSCKEKKKEVDNPFRHEFYLINLKWLPNKQ